MYRNTFVEYNLDDIYYNLKWFEDFTNKKMMAIIKANAYGAIDYYLAHKLENKGVDFFAVSNLEEAIRLRKHGINSKILIMGYVKNLDVVKEYDLAIIIPTFEYVERFKNELKDVKVHIKVNTGLNRLGIFEEETEDVLNALLYVGAKVEGIMTHFACNENEEYTKMQYERFKSIVESIDYKFKYIHAEATDSALYLKDNISNYARIGLGFFGYANIKHNAPLKSAVSLKAEVIYSRKVKEGEGVSYSHHYYSDGESYINTVAIGYADGLSKRYEGLKVLVGDEEGMIVGTVCMDLMMVKTKSKHEVGELVEIFGDNISLESRRDELNTGICRLMTDISDRPTKVFIENGKVVDEIIVRD